MTAAEAFALYQKAEKVWQANLVAAYGSDAGDARYQLRGSMVEGYAEYCSAHKAWQRAMAHDNGATCTCRFETVDSASDEPPETIVDRNCAIHGSGDPDAEAERDDADVAFYDRRRGQFDVTDRHFGYAHVSVSGTCPADATVAEVKEIFYHSYFGGRDAWVKDGRFGCIIHTD